MKVIKHFQKYRSRSLDQLASERTIAWLFVLPAILLLLAVAIFPFAKMIHDSFFAFSQAGQIQGFVGIENYATVLSDSRFLGAISFTGIFVFAAVGVEMLLGLGVALLLHSVYLRGNKWLVVLSLPPMMLSPVVTGLTWRMLLNVQFGPVNHYLGLNIDWIASQPWARVAVLIADIWMWTPLFVLVFVSTLRSIPEIYYEAGRIDGMSKWQRFKWITLPQLKTALVIVLLLRIVRALKIFPKIQVLTLGGPGSYTETIAMRTYQYAFNFFELGVANAAGVLYWLIMFAVAFLIFRSVAEDLISAEGNNE